MAARLLERADEKLAELLADWNWLSTILIVGIVGLLVYPLIFPDEPDTHPLILARQTHASPVRNKFESAVYRSPEVPHGGSLRSGLVVKDDRSPRWAAGRDGDMRDVWRQALKGTGSIMSIMGTEIITHDKEAMNKKIDTMGRFFQTSGVRRMAIYMPNSIEYLETLFACVLYGIVPVMLPYNQPHRKVYELLNETAADGIVAAAASLPLDHVKEACSAVHFVTWIVEDSSRQMDWNTSIPGLKVFTWHTVTEVNANAKLADKVPDVVNVWQPANPQAQAEVVTFSQANISSATAALMSALPLRQRYNAADLVLPADSFSHNYVLCQTLAALFSHCSLAVTSVASPGVDLASASRSASPTIIIASAESLATLHQEESGQKLSLPQKLAKASANAALAAGRMPTDTLITKALVPSSSATLTPPGRLRLILTSSRIGTSPILTSAMLSDLRILTRARICDALTAPKVAGAVAQTHVFDYRREENKVHFGIPLSSVEIKLVSKHDEDVEGSQPRGEIVVTGPAVSGKSVQLPIQGTITAQGTLALV
ncbi:hypothetical protein K470DRAFT_254214 [Piedraia hortae CBS 480.64]|uniref:AMP-dependent synthetase/ligase domain-containing protein n=1 Tax=Piedraia hortae CBS 480.64 TaxID=1314780 RepID=A0A6A7CAY8_9PEZI|nr:hypothetical protein K470DRAFT_254214 [Piedraia hortae CBS 480.64]